MGASAAISGLSVPAVEAAKDETKSKGGAPAKYLENINAAAERNGTARTCRPISKKKSERNAQE